MESITITLTKGRKHRYHLKPLYRLLITSLAAIAAARMIMLAVDIAASRLGPAGGELTIPAYVIIFIYFGWSLRGWIAEAHRAERRRKEKTPCTTTFATPAVAPLTPVRFANASVTQQSSPRNVS